MSATPSLASYLALLTSQNQNDLAPDLLAFASIFLQGHVDNQAILAQLPGLFSLDTAYGWWLDQVGARIGFSRELVIGNSLDDNVYRQILKAVAAANVWDGTTPGAYAVWAIAFGPDQIALQDNQDMTMTIFWIGVPLTSTMAALLKSGQLALKPAAVRITGYFQGSVPDTPLFGWGPATDLIAGWGTGCWVEPIP